MPLGEEIDQLKSDLASKRAAFHAQLDLCDAEQAAGRTGYDLLVEADRLLAEANSMATKMVGKIDEALKALSS